MGSVLFTHSYFLRFDPKQWKTMQPYPPLATLFAASVMRDAGYSVALHDVMFSSSPEEIGILLEKEKPSFFVIYDDGFNYLTKMCLTNMREAAWRMAHIAKENGCKVIVSSSDATDHLEEYLNNGADYVIIGEGEFSLKELIFSLDGKSEKSPDEIQGLAFMQDGLVKYTDKREPLRDLDTFPLPAWDLVDMNAYKKRWVDKYGYFSLNMVTTRGCPYRCNWCAKPIYGNRYNSRSPENVIKELKMLMQKYSPDHIWFSDDIFGLKPKWVQRFAKVIEKEKLKFRYKIQSRVDLLLEEDTIKCLAESGCDTVWLGAESGSQHILDAMDKGITVEQIYKVRPLLSQHNIKVAFFLQFGYLGETISDINLTIKMIKDLVPDEIGVSVSYPLPGTKFYDKVKNNLGDKTNWKDSDDLSMMFRKDIHPDYYKRLQRYLHKEFQFRRGIKNIKAITSFSKTPKSGSLKSALATVYYAPLSIINKARWKGL